MFYVTDISDSNAHAMRESGSTYANVIRRFSSGSIAWIA